MAAQVPFFNVFFEEYLHLNAVEKEMNADKRKCIQIRINAYR